VKDTILALEKDLFFAVKIRDTLQHHGMMVTIARTLPAFEQRLTSVTEDEAPALAIINISITGVDWESAIRAARAHHLPVLAFGSHMDLEARRKALAAGAHKVVANSKFASDMLGLVKSLLEQTPAATTSSLISDDDDHKEEH
jgi:DNA-binding response OmpR family regulator